MTSALLPLIGISLATWLFYNSGLLPKVKEEVCDTTACNYASTIIRNSMNTTVEPCDNFYQFVCGNRESVQSSQSIYEKSGPTNSQFTSLIDYLLRDALESESSPDDILPVNQMKKFYKSCIDLEARRSEGFQRILNEFEKMGGWNSNLTWQEIDRHYENLLGLNAFYRFSFENKLLMIEDTSFADLHISWNSIRPVVENFMQLINAKLSSHELDTLGKLRYKKIKVRRNYLPGRNFTNITLFLEWWKENINVTSNSPLANIDWMDIFQRLSEEKNLAMLKDFSITYYSHEFHGAAAEEYAALYAQSGAIANQVQWNFLLKMMPYVNVEGMENITSTLERHGAVRRSWLADCLLEDEPAIAYLYEKRYNDWSEKADTMFRNTQQALSKRMGFEIPMEFEEKHSRWNNSEAELTDYYEGLTIGDSYIENMFNLKKMRRIRRLKPIASYDPSLPDYYGYGSFISTILSSQMYDRFSNDGHKFMEYFHINPWESQCSYILDIWALEAAWNAYAKVKKEKFPYGEMKLPELARFTNDQMFFISYAEWNCDDPWKIHYALAVTNNFSEAFKCKKKGTINPRRVCNPYFFQE